MIKIFYLVPFLMFVFASVEEVSDEAAKEKNKPIIPVSYTHLTLPTTPYV